MPCAVGSQETQVWCLSSCETSLGAAKEPQCHADGDASHEREQVVTQQGDSQPCRAVVGGVDGGCCLSGAKPGLWEASHGAVQSSGSGIARKWCVDLRSVPSTWPDIRLHIIPHSRMRLQSLL